MDTYNVERIIVDYLANNLSVRVDRYQNYSKPGLRVRVFLGDKEIAQDVIDLSDLED